MTPSETKPSEGADQPAPANISSTSSLDSLFNAYPSPNIGPLEHGFESMGGGATDALSNAAQEAEQGQAGPQQESHLGGSSTSGAAIAQQSSVISPAAHPASNVTDTTREMPALVLPPQQQLDIGQPPPASPGGGVTAATAVGAQAPEFLYQLTKMLTDDNRETIEWCSGKIEVHSPHRLESEVLHKYFRHSKFASFQRQLNYFGFRKQAGKGKMAPCSYVNENLPSTDLSCLLHIKRKTSVSMSAKEKERLAKKKEAKQNKQAEQDAQVNPILAGILQRSTMADNARSAANEPQVAVGSPHQAVAKAAVGRGIRHGYGVPNLAPRHPGQPFNGGPTSQTAVAATSGAPSVPTKTESKPVPVGSTANPLSQLVTNYQNSLTTIASNETVDRGANAQPAGQTQEQPLYPGGFLSRDDSLVDLAMIPMMDGSDSYPTQEEGAGARAPAKQADADEEDPTFSFIDFPDPDVCPPPPDAHRAVDQPPSSAS